MKGNKLLINYELDNYELRIEIRVWFHLCLDAFDA